MAHSTAPSENLPFGLRRKPFQPTADPDFFFQSGQSTDVIDQLVAGLHSRRGVGLLTGEPGTGKTTILRRALDELATRSPLVPVHGNAPLGLDDLVALLGGGATWAGELEEVTRRLCERAEAGRPVVVAIDEAQALDDRMLENLAGLLGSASAPGALGSLLLVGQPALAARLETWIAWGLEIAVRCTLDPLRSEEVGAYIAHRWREAGGEAPEPFSSAAIERIASLSGGVPRLINLLCSEALAVAARQGATRVEPSIVDDVAEDLSIAGPATSSRPPGAVPIPSSVHGAASSRRATSLRHVALVGMGAAAVAMLFLLPWLLRTNRPAPPAQNALARIPVDPPRPPPSPDRPSAPSLDTTISAPEPSREPQAIELTPREGAVANAPSPGPRARTARAARNATTPSSPAPVDRAKDNALLLSVENGDLAGVRALLVAGGSPDARDRARLTPLMLAVIRGNSAISDALLDGGASVNARNNAGQTALMMAAINNNRFAVKTLLARGADVNARTTAGWTALMYAAWKGHPEVVRVLLHHRADASLKDRAGWTAQRYVAWRVSEPTSAERESVVTGIDGVEPSVTAGPGHFEVLNLLTESSRRR
jgi:general secretion pathway protein A